jgi:hypothetical protein
MAGELWRSVFQIGLESTPGTPVAATRKEYFMPDGALTITRDPRVHRYATGTRDNVRAYTNGPIQAGGSISIAASPDESLELFNLGVSGSPVITTPSGATTTRLHTYKPADLASATLEWNDGKRVWQGAGYRANTLTIAGADNAEFTIAADLFGTTVASGTATTGLTDRTPSIVEGWQSRIYVDAFTGTPGTTVVTGFMTNWSIQINNNLGRVYTSDNTLAANRVIAGELDVTGTITVDADSAQAIAEFNNWANATARMVRLEFSDETGFIEGTLRRFITVDIPGNWTAVNIGGSGDGVRRYELSLQSVYQATLAAMLQIRVQCPRTAAFA